MVDVINLCRNTSDGVRPLIPPCFLVSFYTFNKDIIPLFTIIYVCLTLPCICGYEFGICLSFIGLCARKRLNILDVNCFTIIMPYLLSLRIGHILAVFFLIFLYYRKKQDMLDNLMRITVMWNSGETRYNSFP